MLESQFNSVCDLLGTTSMDLCFFVDQTLGKNMLRRYQSVIDIEKHL